MKTNDKLIHTGELHTEKTESPAYRKGPSDQIGKGLGARGHV
jgi:hypothetical protein